MNVIEINDLSDERVRPFASLTDRQLRSEADLIIVESPKVIMSALDGGVEPVALLCERRHVDGDAAAIIARCPSMPVYTGSRDLLASLTGYTLTRGVLCAMRRPVAVPLADICRDARRLAVIDGVCDTTNIGAIFRSAAALGIDGVALTKTSCDPLNRRAIRVSMGTVFKIPWCILPDDAYAALRREGFKIAAMALTDDSVAVDDHDMNSEPRLAIVLGTEGDGLSREAIEGADYVARIPMSRGVDSLNVAAASAVAFYVLQNYKKQ